jgi:hypothetical protein
MPALSYSPQSQPCHLVQTNDCLSGSNQYPFDIRINPNDKADDHKRIFGVELINSGGGFKTYITQQPDQSWRGKIESESVFFASRCMLGKSFGVIFQSPLIAPKLVTCNSNNLTSGIPSSFGKVFKALGTVKTHDLVLRQKAKIWLNFYSG